MSLTFKKLRKANATRSASHFPKCDEWSAADWACALAGEVGEACNFIKKLRRLGPAGSKMVANPSEKEKKILKEVYKEIADVILYADLLANALGVKLEDIVPAKFNEVSERIGSDIKLEAK